MNTQQLKELVLSWSHSEVACMPIEEFSDVTGTPLDDVRILFGAANALDSLIDHLSAAERECDELLAEVARLKNEEHKSGMLRVRVSKQIDALKEQLAKAEAETARRDAAAVEAVENPVLEYADKYRVMASRGVESIPIWSFITDLERNIAPLYTAAQPAVLPSAYEETVDFGDYHLGWNSAINAAIELGAHPQKVVTHPETSSYVGTRQFIFERDAEWIAALDAANVPYEVKK